MSRGLCHAQGWRIVLRLEKRTERFRYGELACFKDAKRVYEQDWQYRHGGIDKRLVEKQRPTAMTGEGFGRFGRTIAAPCGWNPARRRWTTYAFDALNPLG